MASAKSSRSQPAGHSGVFPVGGTAGEAAEPGRGAGSDGGVQLADKLKVFKTDNFDPDAYVQSKCQTMNEKEHHRFVWFRIDKQKQIASDSAADGNLLTAPSRSSLTAVTIEQTVCLSLLAIQLAPAN